ncbi:selenocysteine-specific translation elongation factor [Calidifontibacter sp. DB0510]|uniref:Selenocysteine-specific translation elongation factor n=1 Tax=Metallococcus carri TaxID=1656884 RepID=A0A967B1U5_9MICO|nr:selenocysteine-specific translation elongation factor [Metallococcus carri]NHN57269.1 selenocysteine-specific translation elongation factor [Metallococcus carri]NOP38126.1 selenocysteine-specific translation elongation factor [Calidifontibacter sp. DB2511S]
MRVVATAGHVDHGKSALVRALTGTDPDRLEEEHRRGLTIDLGYAGMRLPSGQPLAFVDVPGHRRFIGNMLAGLGPAPAVVFVVAADQGWQAQSSEHLEAIDALGLSDGLVAITRADLATDERIAQVRADIEAAFAPTSLGRPPVVVTSTRTGQGLDTLRTSLDDLVARMPTPSTEGPVRFWIDRSFTIAGAGTVVTGTLAAGEIGLGDRLDIDGREATVRSVQVLGAATDRAAPVSRVALGLRGVSVDDVPRGTAALTPDSHLLATVIDVCRTGGRAWSDAAPEITLHVGTAAVPVRVRPLDDDHARLRLDTPVPLRLGDRVILRDPSAGRIHCGATVLAIDPPELSRRGAARRRARDLQGRGTSVGEIVADHGAAPLERLRREGATGLDTLPTTLDDNHAARVHGWVIAPERTRDWAARLQELVAQDATDPLSDGLSPARAAHALHAPEQLVPALAAHAGLTLVDGRIRSADHRTGLGAHEAAVNVIRERLRDKPFDAPEADELAELGLDARALATAERRGLLLRLPGGIVLLPDAPARAMRALAALDGPFTASQAKAAWQTSRRVAIPLLEHLDERRWTRRVDPTHRVVVR